MIEVELRRHTGQQATPVGPVEVVFEQYQIVVCNPETGQQCHVGYVGTQTGAPINWLRMPDGLEWPEPIKDAVREEIAAHLGGGVRKEGQPPEPQPAAPDEDDLDDDTWAELDEEEGED